MSPASATQPSSDLRNVNTQPSDPDVEDPQRAGSSNEPPRHKQNMIKLFCKYLVCVILAVVAAVVISALGVLTLPVSVALLPVFIITYIVINIVSSTCAKKNYEWYNEIATNLTFYTTLVAVLLLLSLILMYVVFRVHSGLKHRMIAGLEAWKWLEIALVSCVFCTFWMGGCFVAALVHEEYDYKRDLVYFTSKLRRAINCICFIVGELIVLEVAPTSKKRVIIFGLGLWKWVLVLVSLLCGWYLILVGTHVLILSLELWQSTFLNKIYNENKREGEEGEKRSSSRPNENEAENKSKKRHPVKKYAVFMAKGLRTRINILLFLLLIVKTWTFYVKPRLQLEKESEGVKKAVDFVIRTFLSVLIAAVLSMVKKVLLLLWEARELHKRFTERIIGSYMQLYILAKICGSGWEMFNIWTKAADGGNGGNEDDTDRRSEASAAQGSGNPESVNSTDGASARSRGDPSNEIDNQNKQIGPHKSKQEEKKKRMDEDANVKLEQILKAAIANFVSYDILTRIAKLFLDAEDTLASNKIEELRLKWEENPAREPRWDSNMNQKELVESIKQVYSCDLEGDPGLCLYKQLEADLGTERNRVQYKDFENWLKRAHKTSTELGNTLAGAREVAAYLNNIMIGFLTVVCIVIWLFLTKIATTELIVLLTSPLLAATFIFGDTAKTVFQGIIFTFAVHPFDVGDVCVIQEKQLEVKRIGIWKTTFYKNGNKDEEVMYPNSTLITTSIVKHKFNLDLHDSIVFSVQFKLRDYATEDEAINELIKSIKAHLDNSNDFESGCHEVLVKEIDETVKMEVRFKHKKNFLHMTYSESLKKWNESRSRLLQDIRKLIGQVRIKDPADDTDQQACTR